MKKRIVIAAMAVCILSLQSCKKNETMAEAKIDFTQSYEDAALALATAQKNYDAAVASNVPEKIEAAKLELKSAQDKYVESKNVYIAKGGTIKPEYENYLNTSTQTLKNAVAVTGATAGRVVNGAINTTEKLAKGTVNTAVQTTEKVAGGAINTAETVVQKTGLDDAARKAESGVKSTVKTTSTEIKKTSTEVKKKADQGISKVKEGINSIF
ncbi:hypothetical protein [Chryseobacterium daeguense]|uniref:hypothetical protein n=1 Tax=Chryseobacterium daeguense TaxID=412438 RepID=UPI0004292BF0|nr:hypothetical protein [Chryseobacterium daeguense]